MKIENYGIASSKVAMSKEDEKFQQIFDATTKISDDQYERDLLWKKMPICLTTDV